MGGGGVHLLLGNHEAMNLIGRSAVRRGGEFAAYADLETAADRIGPAAPAGYFGHRAALSARGRYGSWLLAQPVAIMINDTLFMHGGPAPAMQGMSLQELNLRYRTALADYLQLVTTLEQSKLLQAADDFDARPRLARHASPRLWQTGRSFTGDTVHARAELRSWLLSEGVRHVRAPRCATRRPRPMCCCAAPAVGPGGSCGSYATRDLHAVTRFEGGSSSSTPDEPRAYKVQARRCSCDPPSGSAVCRSSEESALSPEARSLRPMTR